MNRIAKIVSYIFHPVFMPILGILVIFNSGIYVAEVPFEFKRFVYAIVFLCTAVLPLTIIPALYFLNMVQKITIDERRQRIIPLFFTSLSFYMAYFLIVKFSPIQLVNLFLLASVIVGFIILLISILWKVSIHMSGIGGITALIGILSVAYSADLAIYLSISLLMGGFIAAARLALNSHTILQLIAGYIVGLITVGAVMFKLIH